MFNAEVFNSIFLKIITNLLSVLIGFLAGRYCDVQRDSIGQLLFYFFAPIVFFSSPASSKLNISNISVTFVMFFICSCNAIFCYYALKRFWIDSARNILSMSAGSSNCGYFMLPIASILFDEANLNIYMMLVIGVALYESSVGYYICAKSIVSTKESIKRILTLPMFNSFVFGVLFSISGLHLPGFLSDFTQNMRSAYSILGMTMIGLGLSTIKSISIDYRFTLFALFIKLIFQPVGMILFILLDHFIFNMYDSRFYKAMILISTAPVAANTIVMANIVNFSVEKVVTIVFISALLSLIYIPTIISFMV